MNFIASFQCYGDICDVRRKYVKQVKGLGTYKASRCFISSVCHCSRILHSTKISLMHCLSYKEKRVYQQIAKLVKYIVLTINVQAKILSHSECFRSNYANSV